MLFCVVEDVITFPNQPVAKVQYYAKNVFQNCNYSVVCCDFQLNFSLSLTISKKLGNVISLI